MFLSYDSEGNVLEVVFDESLHQAEQSAYQLRDGIVVYIAARSNKLVQLTRVCYRELAQIPVIHFAGWQKLTAAARKQLLPIVVAPLRQHFFFEIRYHGELRPHHFSQHAGNTRGCGLTDLGITRWPQAYCSFDENLPTG